MGARVQDGSNVLFRRPPHPPISSDADTLWIVLTAARPRVPLDAGWKHPPEEDGLSHKGTGPSPNPG